MDVVQAGELPEKGEWSSVASLPARISLNEKVDQTRCAGGEGGGASSTSRGRCVAFPARRGQVLSPFLHTPLLQSQPRPACSGHPGAVLLTLRTPAPLGGSKRPSSQLLGSSGSNEQFLVDRTRWPWWRRSGLLLGAGNEGLLAARRGTSWSKAAEQLTTEQE